jgi:hypothetical protein
MKFYWVKRLFLALNYGLFGVALNEASPLWKSAPESAAILTVIGTVLAIIGLHKTSSLINEVRQDTLDEITKKLNELKKIDEQNPPIVPIP